uniref:Defective in cullin neddylation protein n=1 Tax=Vannella robusta TaxID=1487602 RepID=A0A7S4IIV1_9EUKA
MGSRLSKKSSSRHQVAPDAQPKKSYSESEAPKSSIRSSLEKKTHTPANTSNSSSKSKKNQEAGEASGVSRRKIQDLFDKYADGKDTMGPEAVMNFCDDLEVDPEDIAVLILSWHFKAETMCYFKQQEFISGCESLKCDNLAKLKACLKQFPEELKDAQKFKEIYEFAFLWSRESTDKKVLDIETALEMLELLLDEETYPFIGPFCTFLKEQKSYKGVNKDQWVSLLEFCKTIDQDFGNYDENGSCKLKRD